MKRSNPWWLSLIALVAMQPHGSAATDDFPRPRDTEKATGGPMPAREAAAGFHVPAGFHVSVFAAEPDVRNPIAMAWDPRGRLWIAENYTYAERTQRFDLTQRDRVLIFEDADGDGQFDRRTVFTDGVQMLSSIELGFGGAWLLCPPRLLFLPDANGDDIPDGPAQVVLDGFYRPGRELPHVRQWTEMGPRRLAVRPLRCLIAGRDRRTRHARAASRAHPRRTLAVPPTPQALRGPRLTARPIPGGTTGTRSASSSSSTRSTATSGT